MLQPLHDYVLLKKEKEEKTTASGIILTSGKEKSKLAVVASIGADVKDAGYACGDKVLYKEYSGTTMKIDDEEFIVIKDVANGSVFARKVVLLQRDGHGGRRRRELFPVPPADTPVRRLYLGRGLHGRPRRAGRADGVQPVRQQRRGRNGGYDQRADLPHRGRGAERDGFRDERRPCCREQSLGRYKRFEHVHSHDLYELQRTERHGGTAHRLL